MKRLLLLFLLAFLPAWAALRTVQDTLTYADGSLASGTLQITWKSFTRAAGTTVPAGSRTVTITSGSFTVQLEDNATAVEAGTSYEVRYALTKPPAGIKPITQLEYWIVPASSPLTIAAIRTALVPTPTLTVIPGQFSSVGAQKGELIAFGTSWSYLNVGLDGECLSALSTEALGLKWITCGAGGGAPTGATYITQTPHASLTAEQALSALATGILKSTTATGILSIAVGADLPAHNHAATEITSALLALARGGTNADLSATGGAAQFLKQSSVGAAVTVGTIADADVPNTITLDNLTQVTARAIGDTTGDLAASRVDDGGVAATQALFSGAGAAAGFRAIADADVPNLNVLSTGLTASRCVETDGTGLLTVAAATCGVGGGSHNLLSSTHTDTLTASAVLGDVLHGNATPAWARLAGNTTAIKQYLSQTGNGSISAVPAWAQVAFADLSGAATDAQVPDTITLTNLTQIGTRLYSDLQSIPTNIVLEADIGAGLAVSSGTVNAACVANAQIGTTYTVLTGDREKCLTLNNASAIAVTLPQAGASFPDGWQVSVKNLGAGTATITPTISTISGAASIALGTGEDCTISSDGANYEASCFRLTSGTGITLTKSRTGADVAIDSAVVALLGSAQTVVGPWTFNPSSTTEALRLNCETLPSSPTAGAFACDAAHHLFVRDASAWNPLARNSFVTIGDIDYASTTATNATRTRLPIGAAGTYLAVVGGLPSWRLPPFSDLSGNTSANQLGSSVNAQVGTTYTVLNGDRGKLVTHTNAAAIAVTLPQAGSGGNFANDWLYCAQNRGAGTATVTPTVSTIDGAASLAFTTNQGACIWSDGTNYFTMRGVGGGGGGSPGGSGTELQYRGGPSTFSALANSSVPNAGEILITTTPAASATRAVIGYGTLAGLGTSGTVLGIVTAAASTYDAIRVLGDGGSFRVDPDGVLEIYSSSAANRMEYGPGSISLVGGNTYRFTLNNNPGIKFDSNGYLGWTATDSLAASDLQIQRSAAGLLEVNNGTAGTYRDIILRTVIFEGATPDAFETTIVITDPTVDRNVTFPNADSNTVQPLTCGGTDKMSAVSALGVLTCSADVSGGTPAWEGLVNSANSATAYTSDNTLETVTFNFQSAFAASQQFLIRQQTGNPTAGTLLDVRAADVDVVVFRAGDGTNGITVSQAGALTAEGTGAITATLGDSATAFFAAGTVEVARLPSAIAYENEANVFTLVQTIDVGTTPAQALLLSIAQPGVAGTRDSHFLDITGTSFDSAGHDADWRAFVDVTSNAGASTLVVQSRIDAAAFASRLTVTDGSVAGATIFDAGTGFRVAGAAATGNVLRGNATNFVSAQLGFADLTGSATVAQGGTGLTTVTTNALIKGAGASAMVVTGVLVDSSNNLTVPGTITTGDGTVAGEAITQELTANGSEYRSWLAQDAFTAILRMRFGNAVPTAGQVMRFGAPSTNISEQTWGNASGVGGCTNQFARTLNNDAAPTCNSVVMASDLSTFSSADLAGRLTDETGSGLAVFGTSPTLIGVPVIGDGAGNDNLSFTEEATNPTCAAGDYRIWANSADAKMKKCENGTISDMGAAAGGGITSLEGQTGATQTFTDTLGVGVTSAANAHTVTLIYTTTLAGNPALGVDECVFSTDGTGGGILCEGNTADTIEGLLVWPVTTSDRTLTLPDATDTLVGKATTDIFTGKTYDAEGTGNVLTTVSKVSLEATSCSGTTGTLAWDTLATGAPTATCTAGATETLLMRGVADYTDASAQSMQRAFFLPSDWTGNIDAIFWWRTTVTTNSVVWQLQTLCRAAAEVDDAAWNAAQTVTDAAQGTANQLNTATISTVTVTGCAAGEYMHMRALRDPAHASDSLAATASLVGLEITIRRNQ